MSNTESTDTKISKNGDEIDAMKDEVISHLNILGMSDSTQKKDWAQAKTAFDTGLLLRWRILGRKELTEDQLFNFDYLVQIIISVIKSDPTENLDPVEDENSTSEVISRENIGSLDIPASRRKEWYVKKTHYDVTRLKKYCDAHQKTLSREELFDFAFLNSCIAEFVISPPEKELSGNPADLGPMSDDHYNQLVIAVGSGDSSDTQVELAASTDEVSAFVDDDEEEEPKLEEISMLIDDPSQTVEEPVIELTVVETVDTAEHEAPSTLPDATAVSSVDAQTSTDPNVKTPPDVDSQKQVQDVSQEDIQEPENAYHTEPVVAGHAESGESDPPTSAPSTAENTESSVAHQLDESATTHDANQADNTESLFSTSEPPSFSQSETLTRKRPRWNVVLGVVWLILCIALSVAMLILGLDHGMNVSPEDQHEITSLDAGNKN